MSRLFKIDLMFNNGWPVYRPPVFMSVNGYWLQRLVRAGRFDEVNSSIAKISVEDYLTYILERQEEMPKNYHKEEEVKPVCNSWLAIDNYLVVEKDQLPVFLAFDSIITVHIWQNKYFLISSSNILNGSYIKDQEPHIYRMRDGIDLFVNESARHILEQSSLMGIDYLEIQPNYLPYYD